MRSNALQFSGLAPFLHAGAQERAAASVIADNHAAYLFVLKEPMVSAASVTGDNAVGALRPGTTMLNQSL